MKIIKKLALCALFTNVAYSADLPEDHPIKTAVQMAKFALLQHPYLCDTQHPLHRFAAVTTLDQSLTDIRSHIIKDFKICVDNIFIYNAIGDSFLLISQFSSNIKRDFYHGGSGYRDIGSTLDAISAEIDTYIHQSFETHFTRRKDKGEYASAYKLALVYRDANTAHVENTAKASTWIAEIQAKATAEVEQIGNVVYALFLERALQTTEHTRATRIIDSFEKVDAVFHEQLNTCFYAIVNKKTPIVPFAAEQLLLARKLQDMVFRTDDEDDA